MRIRVLIIGIGTGNPDHLTGEAIAALRAADVILVPDKGGTAHDLAELRTQLCAQFAPHVRVIELADPERDRSSGDYDGAVRDWHAERAAGYAQAIRAEIGDGGTVGLLVWGDPAFYDSTIRIASALADHDLEPELRVIPGISSVQLLAARHRLVLNGVGGSIHVTTGRRLTAEYDPCLGNVVVMLDGKLSCAALVDDHPELEIYWGAQLGLPSEALVAGRLGDVLDEIRTTRQAIRDRDGWVMDTYLLRRPEPA